MKVLIQRVHNASVEIDQIKVGAISTGLLLYVCFEKGDTDKSIEQSCEKVLKLRIFSDENGKMNFCVKQANGKILSISQFTLSWDGKKGHRPSFDKSMPPEMAKIMYKKFNDKLRKQIDVEMGRFGADMQVQSQNDGPVTFFLEF